ncbi:MAG: glycosyltransferase [Hyphomicrobiaceae bacterium]
MNSTQPKLEKVIVINDDCVRSGGAAAIALLSAQVLRQLGTEVVFATGDLAPGEDLASCGVNIVRLGGQHLLDGPRPAAALRGLYDSGTRRRLAAWIAAHDTPGTIYHMHNWHKVLSPSIFGALRPVSSRLVLSLHDFFLVCPNGGFFDFKSGRVCDRTPLSASCLATSCDKRSATHKAWRTVRHLVRRSQLPVESGSATLAVVHDGMTAFLDKGGIPRTSVRTILNPVTPWLGARLPAEQNSGFLYVGRLERDKGIHLLADAVLRTGVTLTAIGDGPLLGELQAAYPQIRFPGRLPAEDIAHHASRARAIVVPSLVRETFGLVVLEAAASGLPVIISDSALIADEVRANDMGLVCRAGHLGDLSDALLALQADDTGASRMSISAFQRARAMITSPDDWGETLLALYADVLAQAWSTANSGIVALQNKQAADGSKVATW